jgi:hypothetical protein
MDGICSASSRQSAVVASPDTAGLELMEMILRCQTQRYSSSLFAEQMFPVNETWVGRVEYSDFSHKMLLVRDSRLKQRWKQ